jgi:hypothetical protein
VAERAGTDASAVTAADCTGQWSVIGKPLEFLALIMNARRESAGREPAAKPQGEGRDGGGGILSSMVLRLRAVRSLNLDQRVGEGGGGPAALGGRTGLKVVWKVMRLKHMGPAIREWRAVHAIRASGGSADFDKVVNRALLADLLRPPKGSLPSSEQVACARCRALALRCSRHACAH